MNSEEIDGVFIDIKIRAQIKNFNLYGNNLKEQFHEIFDIFVCFL